MTLIDIQNQVFQIFLKTDILVVQKAVEQIKFDTSEELNTQEKQKLVELALKHLKEIEIVDQISDEKWIIRRNFLYEPQSVEVLPTTANLLANFCNTYYKVSGLEGGEVDVLNITDEDIQSVCQIGTLLLNLLSNSQESEKE